MARQINLYHPILVGPRRPLSARAMVQALAVIALAMVALSAWMLVHQATRRSEFQRAEQQHAAQRQALTAAIAANPALTQGSSSSSQEQSLQTLQRGLTERRQLLDELTRGSVADGHGPATRLQRIAQTVPSSVWLDEVAFDARRLSLTGKTLDPAALRRWIVQIGSDPQLAGQALTTVTVERSTDGSELWRFALAGRIDSRATDTAVAAPAASAAGDPR